LPTTCCCGCGPRGQPQAACAPVRQANSRLADSLWPRLARAAISPAAERPRPAAWAPPDLACRRRRWPSPGRKCRA
jgi:hypothetical protein